MCENVYSNDHNIISDMLNPALSVICKYTESFPQWQTVIFVKTEDEQPCWGKFPPKETDLLVKQVLRHSDSMKAPIDWWCKTI